MKQVWNLLAWLFAGCGIIAYVSAWADMWFHLNLWGVTSQTLFSDAVATGIFAIFFLAWGRLHTGDN